MRPLTPDPRCVSDARSVARTVCAQHGVDEDRQEDVVLVISELVGNAIRHGAAPLSYDVVADQEGVLVLVQDADEHPPGVGAPAPPSKESGRGLFLVGELARDWGWSLCCGGGKRVWATL